MDELNKCGELETNRFIPIATNEGHGVNCLKYLLQQNQFPNNQRFRVHNFLFLFYEISDNDTLNNDWIYTYIMVYISKAKSPNP